MEKDVIHVKEELKKFRKGNQSEQRDGKQEPFPEQGSDSTFLS